MILAAISADEKSNNVRFDGNFTARRYQDEALLPGLLPFLNRHNRQVLFMQRQIAPAQPGLSFRLAT